MRALSAVMAVLAMMPVAARAEAPSSAVPDSLAASRARIEARYYDFDSAAYAAEIPRLEALLGRGADSYVRYYLGMVHAQLGGYLLLTDRDRAGEHLNEAVDQLEAALEEREHADVLALLGSVMGRQIALSPLRAMWLGPRSVRYLERARALDPTNPRVFLELGRSKLYRPAFVGGSVSEARDLFAEALRLGSEPRDEDPLMLRWAEPAEALAYLALAEHALGDSAAATRYADRALELEPNYGFVKREVMNELGGGERSRSGD